MVSSDDVSTLLASEVLGEVIINPCALTDDES